MKNAEVVIDAKKMFAEDLGDLWEVWDEKPKWITAKELFEEDVQDFWESWEDKPKIISAKEFFKDDNKPWWDIVNRDSNELSSASDNDSEEIDHGKKQQDIKSEYEKMQNKGGLISAKDFFKEDDSWWNDTVKEFGNEKVISAKEFFKEDSAWWATENELSDHITDSEEYSEEESSEFSEIPIYVKLKELNAIPAKEFFKEDECWWRDAVEEIEPPEVISASEFFKDKTAWWETDDKDEKVQEKALLAKDVFKEDQTWLDSLEKVKEKALLAKDVFKEDQTWLDSLSKDEDDSLTEECDEAYVSIMSDSSTMYSASEEASSDQFQECDWWLSPDSSEATNAVIKAKDLFKEEAWWDKNDSEDSEVTDTKLSETIADSIEVASVIRESQSGETEDVDSEETQAESIAEEEVKNIPDNLNDMTLQGSPLNNETKIYMEENIIGDWVIQNIENDDNCKSEDEAEDIEESGDSYHPEEICKDINYDTVYSANSNSFAEVSTFTSEKSVPDYKKNSEIFLQTDVDDFLSRSTRSISPNNSSKVNDTHDCPEDNILLNPLLPEETEHVIFLEAVTNESSQPSTCRQSPIRENKTMIVDRQNAVKIDCDQNSSLSRSYEIAINKMDECLARLDAKIAVVDSQLSNTPDLGSNDSLNVIGTSNINFINIKNKVSKSSITPQNYEEDKGETKEKFNVIKVNVRIPQSDTIISTQPEKIIPENVDTSVVDVEMNKNFNKHDSTFDDLVCNLVGDDSFAHIQSNLRKELSANEVEVPAGKEEISIDSIIVPGKLKSDIIDETMDQNIEQFLLADEIREQNVPETIKDYNSDEVGALKTNENLTLSDVEDSFSDDIAIKSSLDELNFVSEAPNMTTSENICGPEIKDLNNDCDTLENNATNSTRVQSQTLNFESESNECQSLCVSREHSIERDTSPLGFSNVNIDKKLWRCSTYEPVSISQYDQMAYLIGKSSSFPGNFKEKLSSDLELRKSQESLLNKPFNKQEHVEETDKVNDDEVDISKVFEETIPEKRSNCQADVEMSQTYDKEDSHSAPPVIPKRSKDQHRRQSSLNSSTGPQVSNVSVKHVATTSSHEMSFPSSSGISPSKLGNFCTPKLVSTQTSVSSPVGSPSLTVPKLHVPSPAVQSQVREADETSCIANILPFIFIIIFMVILFLNVIG